jgi:hypothetical protein
MGAAFMEVVMGVERPRVALLSNGEEPGKGPEVVVAAHTELREHPGDLNFVGNVEGFAIGTGVADVIVADGFAGNVALKVMEGTSAALLGAVRGANVEDVLGHARYLVFYLAGGFAATALQTIVTLSTGTDADAAIPNLGASGAVSAVLGAYLLLLPRARVLTVIFFILREIPAIAFLGFWFVFQLYSGGVSLQHPEAGGGVAFFAHVGGFVFGFLLIKLVQVRPPLRPSY